MYVVSRVSVRGEVVGSMSFILRKIAGNSKRKTPIARPVSRTMGGLGGPHDPADRSTDPTTDCGFAASGAGSRVRVISGVRRSYSYSYSSSS